MSTTLEATILKVRKVTSRRDFLRQGLFAASAFATASNLKSSAATIPSALSVKYIQFDYDYEAVDDGLTLRKNYASYLPKYSWDRDRDLNLGPSYAAYAIAEVDLQSIWLSVTFNVQGDEEVIGDEILGRKVTVRAIEPSGGTQNVLGIVTEKEIEVPRKIILDPTTFETHFERNFEVKLRLENVRLGSTGVDRTIVKWQWQVKMPGADIWSNMEESTHTVFETLGKPNLPWREPVLNPQAFDDFPTIKNSTQLPWTDVLEVACSWAKGSKTEDEAAAQIAQKVHSLGGTPTTFHGIPTTIAYGTAGEYIDGKDVFYCSAFLSLLAGAPGRNPRFNCSDFATIVSTFANILGCDLSQVRLNAVAEAGTVQQFQLNPVWLFGQAEPQPHASDPITSFTYHEVAWKGPWQGNAAAEGIVFDGCERVDYDLEPSTPPHDWKIPANIPFGELTETPSKAGYLHRLVAPGQRLRCVPGEAVRRPLDAPLTVRTDENLGIVLSSRSFRLSGTTGLRARTSARTIESLLMPSAFPGWRLLDQAGITPMWLSKSEQHTFKLTWYLKPADRRDISVEVMVVRQDSVRAAIEVLEQLMRDVHVPVRPLVQGERVGEQAYLSPSDLTIFFRRRNFVVRVSSVSGNRMPLNDLAEEIDKRISRNSRRRR